MVYEEGEEDPIDNQIHHFNDINSEIYVTEEEHNLFPQEDENPISEIDLEKYHRGYQNTIDDLYKKLKLRSPDVIKNKGKPNPTHLSTSQQNSE